MKKLGEPVQQVKMATTMESKMLKLKLTSRSGEIIEKELIKTTKIKVQILSNIKSKSSLVDSSDVQEAFQGEN